MNREQTLQLVVSVTLSLIAILLVWMAAIEFLSLFDIPSSCLNCVVVGIVLFMLVQFVLSVLRRLDD